MIKQIMKKITTNMSNLESEESAEQKVDHRGQGLKILTPQQMLSGLPIY